MSILSADHTFESFTPGKSVAYAGQRLCKVTFKYTEKMEKAGEKKRDSVCCSIPQLPALHQNEVAVLMPHILGMLEKAQDAIVREIAESNGSSVNDAQIAFPALVEYLESEAKGERLTSEMVREWFNGELADTLAVAFADKLGISDNPTPEQEKRITQTLNVYREQFASLAGGKTTKSDAQIEYIEKALKFARSDDSMASRFVARCESMKRKNAESAAAMQDALSL